MTKSQKTKMKSYTPDELLDIFKKSPYTSGHTLRFLKWLKTGEQPQAEEKIVSVNGGTCNKCGKEDINIVGTNIHQCPSQTEEHGWAVRNYLDDLNNDLLSLSKSKTK